jgi:hypothetical protein
MTPLPLPDPELADDAICLRAPITLKGRTWSLVSSSLRPEHVAS